MDFEQMMISRDAEKVLADIRAGLAQIEAVTDPGKRLRLLQEVDATVTGIIEPMIEERYDAAA